MSCRRSSRPPRAGAAGCAKPRRRLEERRAEEARPIPGPRPQRLQDAKRRLEEEHRVECQANADYEAYRARGRMKDGRRFGRPPDPHEPPATPAGKVNLTDPDSRNVKTPRGWVQGYNAQAVCTQKPDRDRRRGDQRLTGLRAPRTDDRRRRDWSSRRPGSPTTPAIVLADAGYWHQDQMEQLTGRGTVVLIPPDAGKRKGARPGWDGGLYAFMRRVLATDRGGELYAKRKGMIEPIFADTKFNRRCDRFQRRGRSAARSEWRLITATHNLERKSRVREPGPLESRAMSSVRPDVPVVRSADIEIEPRLRQEAGRLLPRAKLCSEDGRSRAAARTRAQAPYPA